MTSCTCANKVSFIGLDRYYSSTVTKNPNKFQTIFTSNQKQKLQHTQHMLLCCASTELE